MLLKMMPKLSRVNLKLNKELQAPHSKKSFTCMTHFRASGICAFERKLAHGPTDLISILVDLAESPQYLIFQMPGRAIIYRSALSLKTACSMKLSSTDLHSRRQTSTATRHTDMTLSDIPRSTRPFYFLQNPCRPRRIS